VRAGTYAEAVTISRSGTASAPITLVSYTGETAILDGGSNIALATSGAAAYWVVENMTIKSTNRYTVRLGWWGGPLTTYWTLKGNKIVGSTFTIGSYQLFESNDCDGTGYTGTQGDAGLSDASTSHHNVFRNNTVHDFTKVDARGIWTQGLTHDNLIEGNVVTNIMATSGIGQGIDLDGASNVEWRHVVRNNVVRNCNYVGIQLENVFASTIENNVLVDTGSAGIIVISYDAGAGCKVGGESNQYGDTNGDNNCQGDPTNDLFRQNLIYTSTWWGWGYGGIVNWNAGKVLIWGNTISAAGAYGNGAISFWNGVGTTSQSSLRGNIIYVADGIPVCAADYASFAEDDHNLLFNGRNNNVYATGSACDTSPHSLQTHQTSYSKGTGSVQGDPLFVSRTTGDFHLQSTSPALDKGVDLGLTTDLGGNARLVGAGYDIGAYERQ
jgi:hypothetical protein